MSSHPCLLTIHVSVTPQEKSLIEAAIAVEQADRLGRDITLGKFFQETVVTRAKRILKHHDSKI